VCVFVFIYIHTHTHTHRDWIAGGESALKKCCACKHESSPSFSTFVFSNAARELEYQALSAYEKVQRERA
jgi:hypothetical protein